VSSTAEAEATETNTTSEDKLVNYQHFGCPFTFTTFYRIMPVKSNHGCQSLYTETKP